MRVGKHIFLGTAALVAGFVSLLCGSILLLSFLHGGSASNQGAFLMPDAAVAPPTAQELLQKKFEIYNTVTEEDGKSVVTIFSEEQIEDIRTRRENGEWFWLSGEEMLYLINDTVKLFETYDVVKVRDLEGVERVYDRGNKKSLAYDVILERVKVLNSAVYLISGLDNLTVLTGVTNPLTEIEAAYFSGCANPWYGTDKFTNDNIIFWAFTNTQKGKYVYTWDNSILSDYEVFGGEEFWVQRITVYSIN